MGCLTFGKRERGGGRYASSGWVIYICGVDYRPHVLVPKVRVRFSCSSRLMGLLLFHNALNDIPVHLRHLAYACYIEGTISLCLARDRSRLPFRKLSGIPEALVNDMPAQLS
jgi:hypothetical protein